MCYFYHIHQASEQAETTRAYFKQHDGLMVSPVRFSPKKFEEYLQTGKSVFKMSMSYSCHQQLNKQDEVYEWFGGHRHSQGWLDVYTTWVAAKTHSEVPGLV